MVRSFFISLFFSGLVIFACQSNVQAQSLQDIQNVNVSELSEAQIKKIQDEVQARGLSMDQAAQIARSKGASEVQINELMTRMNQYSTEQDVNDVDRDREKIVDPEEQAEEQAHSTGELSNKTKRIFGHSLFNNEKLSFQPDQNIPVPENYTITNGDQVIISVWGNNQQNYSLEVGKNGSINIPGVGMIYIAGQSLESARTTILNRLTSIYSDMQGETPTTFADVAMGSTQPIQINIIGEAVAPGTYSLPGTASAFNALFLSGGPNANGSFRNIQVIRDNKILKTIDIYEYLINKDLSNNIPLKTQDVIYIPVYDNHVVTSDGFKRNAIFEVKNGETIEDLIKYAGGFATGSYTDRLTIDRSTSNGYKLTAVDKADYSSFILQNGDSISIGKQINEYENRVSIDGAVYRPGDYELSEGMMLSELVSEAGGLIPDYFSNRGIITRLDYQRYPTIIPFDVDKVMKGTADVKLQKEDQIQIKNIFDIGEPKFVRIEGEVLLGGEFEYSKNMLLKDLIFMAGGLKESASEASIEVARRRNHEEAEDFSEDLVSLYTFSIDRDLNLLSEDENFKIEPYDYVYIRKAPSYEEQKTVSIYGEVKYPGKYVISNKEERISDLIERAGGLSDYAYLDAAYMTRGMSNRTKENLRKSVKNTTNTSDARDTDLSAILDQNQSLELQLSEIIENPGDERDYILKEGDQIFVPIKSEEIWVSGAVLNPSGLAYDGKNMKKYIDASGGFVARAKKNKSYVIYANGRSASTKGFIFRKYPKVEPGSQIIIPLKPEKQPISAGVWISAASMVSSLTISVVALFR